MTKVIPLYLILFISFYCSNSTSDLDTELKTLLTKYNVSSIEIPNPENPALVSLGESLFFDKILSGNRNIACSTCHHPSAFSGDALSLSIGEGGTGQADIRIKSNGLNIPRNAPGLFNLGLPAVKKLFWDNRIQQNENNNFKTPEDGLNGPTPLLTNIVQQLDSPLAAQALFPVTSHAEMRGQAGSNELADATDNITVWKRIMDRLNLITEYRNKFNTVYNLGTDLSSTSNIYNIGHVAKAIAAYEKQNFTALSSNFDLYLNGNKTKLNDFAKRGAILFFGEAQCWKCHNGPLLSNFQPHSLATPQIGPGKTAGDDRGLALQTNSSDDNYKFRTPPLRNVELTGPWTHSGAFTTLENVVKHHLDPAKSIKSYDASQLRNDLRTLVDKNLDREKSRISSVSSILIHPYIFQEYEVDQIVAFLKSLTDENSRNNPPEVPNSVPSSLPVAD